jgi:dihydrofolate reductase
VTPSSVTFSFVVTGSITVVHQLIAHGVVDEYRLFVYPVMLGRGARLFEGATNVSRS